MDDDPVELDQRRGMAAQQATDLRRRLHAVQADQAALKQRQVELETFLASAPATTWTEAAERACYLLRLFAGTPEAQDPRRQKLIESVIEELKRLTA
ncbi:MAG TPA: hypothetical protein VMB84_16365 [Stellaceae bacterium]|nr:hypothetical protein [Stellaceae bacterium]